MRRATAHVLAGGWSEDEVTATVTLGFNDRHRRRIRLSDDAGEPFLLDLPKAARLEEGDALAIEEGGIIRVRAAEEDVLDIECAGPAETARVAWHIGNRHIPVQVLGDGGLRIADDHVLAKMLEGLGATVSRRRAPFSPESGAYAEDVHGHHHSHD